MLFWGGDKKKERGYALKKKRINIQKPLLIFAWRRHSFVWFWGMGKGILLFSKQVCSSLLSIVSQEKCSSC